MSGPIVLICPRCGTSFRARKAEVMKGRKFCTIACRRPHKTIEERFWSHVNKSGQVVRDELGPCWEWTASRRPRRDGNPGYGQFNLPDSVVYAHRFAWKLTHGQWPEPCALHKCDNMICVRPDHMFEGDYAENHADMTDKGRATLPPRHRGGSHPSAVLTEADVVAIRQARAGGEKLRSIAERYGLTTSYVWLVANGKTWKHVA